MQLSCLPVSLFSDIRSGKFSVRDWSLAAAKMPLDAFDISIMFVKDRTPVGLRALRNELAAGGLPLCMIATYPDFTVPDDRQLEWEIQRALADISISAELGASYVRITAGQFYSDASVDRQLDQVVEAFSTCAASASRWGIRLIWENHSKPGAWDQSDFNFNAVRLERMYARLKGGAIGLNYDTANATALGFGPELFERYADSIRTIHLNDLRSVEPLSFCGVGDGLAPLAQTLSSARKTGFDGFVSLEEASMQGLDGVRKYVAVARALIDAA